MSRNQIIDDIQSQAQAEVDSIQTQTESTLAQRRSSLETKLADISQEADARIKDEENRVQVRLKRYLDQEERRVRLVLQARVVNSVIAQVQDDLKSLPESPEYASLLRDWIIEAAIGLGYGTASRQTGAANAAPARRAGDLRRKSNTKAAIRCNPRDRSLLETEIPAIQKRFLSLTGCELELAIDESAGLSTGSIGIILVDETGRTAFSNTLADRFRRNAPEIHRLVMGKIFPGRTE